MRIVNTAFIAGTAKTIMPPPSGLTILHRIQWLGTQHMAPRRMERFALNQVTCSSSSPRNDPPQPRTVSIPGNTSEHKTPYYTYLACFLVEAVPQVLCYSLTESGALPDFQHAKLPPGTARHLCEISPMFWSLLRPLFTSLCNMPIWKKLFLKNVFH